MNKNFLPSYEQINKKTSNEVYNQIIETLKSGFNFTVFLDRQNYTEEMGIIKYGRSQNLSIWDGTSGKQLRMDTVGVLGENNTNAFGISVDLTNIDYVYIRWSGSTLDTSASDTRTYFYVAKQQVNTGIGDFVKNVRLNASFAENVVKLDVREFSGNYIFGVYVENRPNSSFDNITTIYELGLVGNVSRTFFGLSTDVKRTLVPIGSTFYEIDTTNVYIFNGTTWGLL